ncbi:MAG: undecaprenyl/decaprenyl-phosphate alpha-N-acetylglucosaminyl 1-phosphate transferase [Streptococcaceae bacterium]|jgi:UDP-GlcNAc:undecaprenyl-phosphate GlcNAc-1-phosphate transferase|nr:undecaprenyl/decaprenyl-phosphate alpha-N-acetylglucosaminyl 1-phosphate transferase [Streptococcaceae bacterium]
MFDLHNHPIPFTVKYMLVLGITFLVALILTPIVRWIAFRVGAYDVPNARRMNTKIMPTSGGLAIFISFAITTLFILPHIVQTVLPPNQYHDWFHYIDYVWPYVLAGGVVILTGYLDDIFDLRPRYKVLGITIAAAIIWFMTYTRLDNFKIPFGGPLIGFPSWLSFVFTIIWIVLITNAMNIIDGLDGLVSGVSIISLLTMGIVAYFFLPVPNVFIPITIFTLVAAIAGFFPFNFNPAIIYLGDTGALFLGFMLSIFSLQGLKNATAVATLTPLLILGVPLTDSVVATIRRTLNKQKFYLPDKMHLHHRLLQLGFTVRGAVYLIYGIASIFASIAIILNISGRLGGILLIIASLFGIEIFIELVGVLGKDRHPLLNIFKYIGNIAYRENIRARHQGKQIDLEQTIEIHPIHHPSGKKSENDD